MSSSVEKAKGGAFVVSANNELFHFTCANAYIGNFSARRISDLLRDMYAREVKQQAKRTLTYIFIMCFHVIRFERENER